MKSCRPPGNLALSLVCCLFIALVVSAAQAAEDAYFDVPLDHLALTEGKLPKPDENARWNGGVNVSNYNHVVLDGPGEAYLSISPYRDESAAKYMVVRAPEGKDVTGRVFVENEDKTGMVQLKFKIPAGEAKADAKGRFYQGMQDHYQQLMSRGVPGAAWFRYRLREAHVALGNKDDDNQQQRRTGDSLDSTYSLFDGNQALAENLQLDKALPRRLAQPGEADIDVDSIKGIEIAAMDWKDRIAGKTPATDVLAGDIPADQHAIFFHNFDSLIALADEADRDGTPVLQMTESRSEDAGTRSRYERQLALPMSELGKLLGPQLINSVAITGSDPYLRSGSDVAILFEPKMGDVLKTALWTQITAARKTVPDAKEVDGKLGSLSYMSMRSPDRTLCSYLAVLNSGTVVVTNSPAQLTRLAAVQDGKAPALVKAPEYIFFRDRYKLDDPEESALLILTDATIRRWCNARWRIGDSRRTLAAGVLSDLNARNLDTFAAGKFEAGKIYGDFLLPNMGEMRMTPRGAASGIYGSLDFLTPISEMNLEKVTRSEADAYGRWRQNYETNWRWAYDPIALRFHISPKKIAADLTVMPLIAGSEYRDIIDFASGAKIDPMAVDPHDCLFRSAFSINTKAPRFREAAVSVSEYLPGLKVEPFGWVGESICFYADNDPFWAELAKAEKPDEFMEKNIGRIPFALRVQVSNGFKLAAFLVAIHGFVDHSAPDMTIWENLTYKDQSYIKITPTEKARGQTEELKDIALYYTATADAFLLTLNEGMLKSAIDRQLARDADKKAGKPIVADTARALLGENLILQASAPALDLLQLGRNQYDSMMQQHSWNNLPILNEWKHRYPDKDPLKLYEQYFHAKLIDPAGGQYVWNDKWQTMESTTYGSPAEPKKGPAGISALKGIVHANFGVTFENQGLRRGRKSSARDNDNFVATHGMWRYDCVRF